MNEEGYFVPVETLAKLGGGDIIAGRKLLRALIDIEVTHEPVMGPTERPVNVRAATEEDAADIIELIRQDISENARPIAPLSEDKVKQFLSLPTSEGGPSIGVIDGPDGIVGMIAMILVSWWWSDRWFAFEQFNFVASEHRASRHGADLLRYSRWYTDQMSVQLGYRVFLLSGVTATKDPVRKMAVYGRLSNRVGGFYCYPDPTQVS